MAWNSEADARNLLQWCNLLDGVEEVGLVLSPSLFELQVEVVEGKLKGRIWEICRGTTSWIRFGEVSLSHLLDGVEACCRDNGNRRWVLDWEEGGGRRKYRLERR
ncbi:hypothetical protein CK203_025791 [Vitis vinifera]|uniref:DUF4283 domain-containing protein n=1 Tax=Vitis vinifera TaxID=29760 RepID=A0A438IGJ9_VITVI|nr:hypothetical protein CK203_025791 [Vitis vinifera]